MWKQFYLFAFCNYALLVQVGMKLCTTGSLTFTLEYWEEERKGKKKIKERTKESTYSYKIISFMVEDSDSLGKMSIKWH